MVFMDTVTTAEMDMLNSLEASACGRVRTARKPWRCVCAEPIRRWQIRTVGHTADGREVGSTTWTTTEEEARARGESNLGHVAAWNVNVEPAQPSAYIDSYEVEPVPNPNYRPDCLGDIAVGDRYFEYLGESVAWESGFRYCARCAVVWVGAS